MQTSYTAAVADCTALAIYRNDFYREMKLAEHHICVFGRHHSVIQYKGHTHQAY